MMSDAYPLSRRLSLRRRALLLSCGTLAIAAVALTPQKARAQFNGTIDTESSTGINTSTSNSGSIYVTNPTATVYWTPDNSGTGTITFLGTGDTATFYGPGS
ncbi:MAG: hypothetical protein ACLGHC_06135, partial [Alphaproteobacteria bacterium]